MFLRMHAAETRSLARRASLCEMVFLLLQTTVTSSRSFLARPLRTPSSTAIGARRSIYIATRRYRAPWKLGKKRVIGRRKKRNLVLVTSLVDGDGLHFAEILTRRCAYALRRNCRINESRRGELPRIDIKRECGVRTTGTRGHYPIEPMFLPRKRSSHWFVQRMETRYLVLSRGNHRRFLGLPFVLRSLHYIRIF